MPTAKRPFKKAQESPDSALTDFREFCRTHGIKSQWVAGQIGMATQLLRYYLDKEQLPTDIEEQLRQALRKLGKQLRQEIPRRKRFFK